MTARVEWVGADARYVIEEPVERRRRGREPGQPYTHGGRPLAWIVDAEWRDEPIGSIDCGAMQEGDIPEDALLPGGAHHGCTTAPASAAAKAKGEHRIFSCDWRIGTPLDPREPDLDPARVSISRPGHDVGISGLGGREVEPW